MPPGTIYDAATQCRLIYPNCTGACDMGPDDYCKLLMCHVGTQCLSNEDPPADGTKCGANKVTTSYW